MTDFAGCEGGRTWWIEGENEALRDPFLERVDPKVRADLVEASRN